MKCIIEYYSGSDYDGQTITLPLEYESVEALYCFVMDELNKYIEVQSKYLDLWNEHEKKKPARTWKKGNLELTEEYSIWVKEQPKRQEMQFFHIGNVTIPFDDLTEGKDDKLVVDDSLNITSLDEWFNTNRIN